MSQHKSCNTNTGGGVCCHHSILISYPHVFFSQSFLIFFINHLTFFLLLSCVCDAIEYILDTNCVLHTKLYVINVISTFYKHNKKKTELIFLSLGD